MAYGPHPETVMSKAPADSQLRQRVRQMWEEQRRLVDDLQAQIGEDARVPQEGGGCFLNISMNHHD